MLATLGPGDLVFTGYQASSVDKISFVLLKAVDSGTVLAITDNAWSGTALTTNEGNSVITFGGTFSAGTQFNYDASRSAGLRWAVGASSTGISDVTSGSFALNASGDNLFAYNGATPPATGNSPLWVSAFASSAFLNAGPTTSNLTLRPDALVASTTSFSLGLANGLSNQNGAYTASSVTGTVAQIQNAVYTLGNWTTFTTAGSQVIPPTATFTVQATGNNAPTGLVLSNSTIHENAGVNAVVGTLSTIDPDPGNTFTYALVSGAGSTDNASFNISGDLLRANNSLDYETKSSYGVRIRTADQGGLFFEQSFIISVTDVNEAASLRIVSYNLVAGSSPNMLRPGLDTVLQAIGEEVVGGITRPIDILAMQEIYSQANTSAAVASMLNGIYGASIYAHGVLNGDTTGSGTLGVVYNTASLQLLSETTVGFTSVNGQPRQTLRYHFQPLIVGASTDFYLYNSHWKASDDQESRTRRQVEAQAIRSNADSLGQGMNIIYVGDYNLYTSSEAAFQTMIGVGNGQAFDPINRIGSWSDNPSFIDVFTQAPAVSPPSGLVGGGLDDRFDFQLISGELTDGLGLDYRPGSYRAFGNNGSVAINNSVNIPSSTALGGLANRTTVLNLLTTVSDHLPVVADYVLNAAPSAEVVAQYVYHAGSSFDQPGNIENALDTGKQLAKEGASSTVLTYDNLINTSRGINGLVFDIANLPGTVTASDFVFQLSPQGAFNEGANPVSGWEFAPSPSSVAVLFGLPSRVVITWLDNVIVNRWLRITLKANANTGLDASEVYYIGHLLGETTGPTGSTFTVSFADITPIRSAVGSSVNASSTVDIDKNGTVAFADISAMRPNVGAQLTIITIPASGSSSGQILLSNGLNDDRSKNSGLNASSLGLTSSQMAALPVVHRSDDRSRRSDRIDSASRELGFTLSDRIGDSGTKQPGSQLGASAIDWFYRSIAEESERKHLYTSSDSDADNLLDSLLEFVNLAVENGK